MVDPGSGAVNHRAGAEPAGWVVVALGSNLGDRAAFLAFARRRLAERGVPFRLAGPIEETAPLPGSAPGQGPYLNQVLATPRADVPLDPPGLLAVCRAIEDETGRVRGVHWGPRTLDLDIVLFGDLVVATPDLVVPHPGLAERPFVLGPLAALLPDLVHPRLGRTMADLLRSAGSGDRAVPGTPAPRA